MESMVPKADMMFDSEKDAHKFYSFYAKAKGFGVAISNSKNKKGIRHWVQFSCHKFGTSRSIVDPMSSHPTTKTNCKAAINITRQFDDRWKVNSVHLEHNHDMDPEKAKYLKCYRNVPAHIQRDIELNCEAGIRINKTINSIQRRTGGNEDQTWIEKDLQNHMDKVKREAIKGGDAQAMTQYFQRMQADNNNFYYSIDLDEENCLRSVFWADARSREAYKEFGDVVTFDTTYLVNKYNMPFAPFIGVNHHGHSTLLGCGLVTHENTESFVWLFKAWLTCMSNVPPCAIITDQDRAMQNAIEQVFPNTKHRWCLWHIMKKIPEKFKAHSNFEQICNAVSEVVYDSYTIPDFENNWANLIRDYNLSNDSWLHSMYDDRDRWIPTFVTNTFWAGMSTTQRSESINAFFDGYVHRKTSLKEFVEQYENALRKKVEKEELSDAKSMNSQYPNVSLHAFEHQFRDTYTNKKYKQFRIQLNALINCEMEVGPKVDDIEQFVVEHTYQLGKSDFKKTTKFIVRFNEKTAETNCICRMFESKGMVCPHILSVWKKKKLSIVPEKYILHRWSKNAIRRHTSVKLCYTNWQRKPEWCRLDALRLLFNMAADGVIFSESMTDRLKELLAKFIEDNKEHFLTGITSIIRTTIGLHSLDDEMLNVRNPSQGVKNGRPEEKRKVSTYEKKAKKNATKRKKLNSKQNEADKYNASMNKGQDFRNSQKSVNWVDLNEPPTDWGC